VGVHKVGEGVDENDADTAGDIYGLQFLALAAACSILRLLTCTFYHETPATEGLATTP
jgi:hypothetical protein